MSNAAAVRTYLDTFTADDDGLVGLITDDFSWAGPLLQSQGKAAFLEGSQAARAMAKGYTLLRQFEEATTWFRSMSSRSALQRPPARC